MILCQYLIGLAVAATASVMVPLLAILGAFALGANVDNLGGAAIAAGVAVPFLFGGSVFLWTVYGLLMVVLDMGSGRHG